MFQWCRVDFSFLKGPDTVGSHSCPPTPRDFRKDGSDGRIRRTSSAGGPLDLLTYDDGGSSSDGRIGSSLSSTSGVPSFVDRGKDDSSSTVHGV